MSKSRRGLLSMLWNGLWLFVQIPLAILSFVLFKAFRWLMRRLANFHYKRRKDQAFRWRPLSRESLRNPLALPLLMTSAPRWNPHAIIATLGPLPVKQSLAIDVAAAFHSAASWSIVFYTFPNFRTVASIDSLSVSSDKGMDTLSLQPGRYWIGLRYYLWGEEVSLPEVQVDGQPVVPAVSVPPNVNDFYQDLSQRRSLFYCFLHYYVWVLLRLRRVLPRSLVEREYLPVGNPGTHFYYGLLRKGQRLSLQLHPTLLGGHDVYLTCYSRASLPISWRRITEAHYLGDPAPLSMFYLVRVHPRVKSNDFVEEWVKVAVS